MQESDVYEDHDGKCDPDDKACNNLVERIKNNKKLNFGDMTKNGLLRSWEGEKNIDPGDWQKLLSALREDVHSTPAVVLRIEAPWYDSPFFNGDTLFTKPRSGRGCLGDKCYNRSELNYVAQGELWAAVGVTNKRGHEIVEFWKESKCLWLCERTDLQEEHDMFDIGYNDYQEVYPP